MVHPGGRPPADINWEKVKSLLEAGCSGREIAGNIGINPATLYRRCVDEYGIEFSEFSQQHQAKGESRLLAHQYAKALGLTNEGDNTLLIWLGKVRLKQKEQPLKDDNNIIVKLINAGSDNTEQVQVPPVPGCGVEGDTERL